MRCFLLLLLVCAVAAAVWYLTVNFQTSQIEEMNYDLIYKSDQVIHGVDHLLDALDSAKRN